MTALRSAIDFIRRAEATGQQSVRLNRDEALALLAEIERLRELDVALDGCTLLSLSAPSAVNGHGETVWTEGGPTFEIPAVEAVMPADGRPREIVVALLVRPSRPAPLRVVPPLPPRSHWWKVLRRG